MAGGVKTKGPFVGQEYWSILTERSGRNIVLLGRN